MTEHEASRVAAEVANKVNTTNTLDFAQQNTPAIKDQNNSIARRASKVSNGVCGISVAPEVEVLLNNHQLKLVGLHYGLKVRIRVA